MKITVTQDHIARGRQGAPNSCPVALALKETSSDFANVTVGPQYFFARDNNFNIIYESTNLPKEVQQFIKKFDTGNPVKPFSFEI